MKNKELALRKIDSIKNFLPNLKNSIFRGGTYQQVTSDLERMETMIEDLENLINIENEENLQRPYRGL
jgi:hypothetical protein